MEEGSEEKAENQPKINANRRLISHFSVQRKVFYFIFVSFYNITIILEYRMNF